MPSSTRRGLLASGLGLLAAIAGCSALPGRGSEREWCREPPEGPEYQGGNAAPWVHGDSDDDVVIESHLDRDVTVTLAIDDDRREIQIDADGRWRSPDLIPDGARPAVTVETASRSAAVEWPGERNNAIVATFAVRADRIDADVGQKFCPT